MSQPSYRGGGGGRGSSASSSSRGRGGRPTRGGGAPYSSSSGGPPRDSGCFKCGQVGHISRECTAPSRGGGRGGGRGGRGGGFGNLDINIDGTLKTDVGKILKEFQENPDLQEYAFPPDLNNTERRFIHTFCKNFGLTSKSTGGPKGSPQRYVVIYKNREKKEDTAARKHPLASLSFNAPDSATLIDGFLQHFALPPEMEAKANRHPQKEINLAELAKNYIEAKTTPEREQLSKNLQQLQAARDAARQSKPPSTLQQFRAKLPIAAQREDILKMVDDHQVLVLSSSTGSGKSTQVPQYLLEHLDARGLGGGADIVVTQPRRISAMSLAQRVAQEREVEKDQLGDTVGYQIRLESCRSNKTRLLYCTIGVLLRRLSADRLLRGISHIIVDEVHERDRLCDFLLIILRDILPLRPDLKLILMSATLNADMFSSYFGAGTPHIHIEGFTHPVHTFYLEDVIELTGYRPPSLGRVDASQRRQIDDAKEKRLRDVLNAAMSKVLTLEEDQSKQKKAGGLLVNPKGDMHDDEGEDDEAALAALAGIAGIANDPSAVLPASLLAPSTNKVTGWTDTYEYKPTVENPWAAETDAVGASETNMMAALDALTAPENDQFGGAPPTAAAAASSSSSTTLAAPKSAPARRSSPLHPSQISSAALTSSLTMLSKPNSSPTPNATLQNPLSGLTYSQDTLDAIRKIEEEGQPN